MSNSEIYEQQKAAIAERKRKYLGADGSTVELTIHELHVRFDGCDICTQREKEKQEAIEKATLVWSKLAEEKRNLGGTRDSLSVHREEKRERHIEEGG